MHRFCSIVASLLVLSFSTIADAAQLPEHEQKHEKKPPRIMLWSWQRIEDLRGLDPSKAGVALLIGRFSVDQNKIALEPRLSQLQLPPGCYREAVARVEMKQMPAEGEIDEVSAKLASSIVHLVLAHSRFDGVQIDFDAKQLERPFYVKLLKHLRQQLPPNLTLSMTALASWSQGDHWLRQSIAHDQLPVDYVVPMFFTMGVGKEQALRLLQDNLPGPFNGHCALGLSLSEASTISLISPKLKNLDRIYLFCSPGWQKDRMITAGNLVNQTLLKEKDNGI
ncbi:MAG: DUF3142 domain-containing protein [Candidatus Melainabacteria bacterium]|nr:DUF3142 domain-containing protein [Candidatus Melainabacteria bacterium]